MLLLTFVTANHAEYINQFFTFIRFDLDFLISK